MKKTNGSSIIEVVIYTFLTLTLLLVLTDIFSSLLDKSKESISMTDVEIDGKFISQKILNVLPQAFAITSPVNIGDTATTLSFVSNGTNYSYYLSGVNLYLDDGLTSERLNSYGNEVTNFTITKYGNAGGKPVFKISFHVKSTIIQPKGFEERTYNLTVGTR